MSEPERRIETAKERIKAANETIRASTREIKLCRAEMQRRADSKRAYNPIVGRAEERDLMVAAGVILAIVVAIAVLCIRR